MKTIYWTSAVAIALMFGSGPASATDARTAITLCDKNPQCKMHVNSNGSVDLNVGDNFIHCPQEGQCVCDVCSPPPGRIKSKIVLNPDKVAKSLAIGR